jgi:glucose-6-phosphate 1-dehydrogenase
MSLPRPLIDSKKCRCPVHFNGIHAQPPPVRSTHDGHGCHLVQGAASNISASQEQRIKSDCPCLAAMMTMRRSYAPHMASSNLCRYEQRIPEAYERLILDVVHGNQQHFVRRDELRASWHIFTPILHALDHGEGGTMHKYPYGARSFPAMDDLIAKSGYVRSSVYNWKAKH